MKKLIMSGKFDDDLKIHTIDGELFSLTVTIILISTNRFHILIKTDDNWKNYMPLIESYSH